MYKMGAISADKACDGIAMACRAGAEFVDMEMVQFHPTGLIGDESRMTSTILEEGLRGAGGRLLNGRGERFMERYEPKRLERSTCDVVARGCYFEIQAGRGTKKGGVWIDMSHLDADAVERNFPGTVRRCRDLGFDLTREPVEVSPAAHFLMGGLVIDAETRTSLDGLFSAGEDAGAVHGANLLGGNSVAESTVFGCIAGDVMPQRVSGRRRASDAHFQEVAARALRPLARSTGERVLDIKAELQALRSDKAGLVRNGNDLHQAMQTLHSLVERLHLVSVQPSRRYNPEWQEYLNVENLLVASRLIVASAIAREDSRGSHFRTDFPSPDVRFLKNVYIDRDLKPELRPVKLSRLQPDGA
jgi:succinate dehydrogenase / fumarate reductase flavoprotein subunit/fumarate reductase flavoprotein subunit